MHLILRLLKYSAVLFLAVLIVLFFQFNVFALQLAESCAPGTGWLVFLVLTLLEALGFLLLWRAWFPRQAKLILRPDSGPAEREAFAKELRRRLRDNPLVQAAGISPSQPDFDARAMAVLDEKAHEIIKSDARKVFLGTALAQNGRLDALIVFLALARMVWRISGIYNQRPAPAEIWSVYTTVSSSAFVAFSLDALDIPRTVTEALSALVPATAPAMASTTMPFLGPMMHHFSAAMLDGAANGLLAIRTGVLTKNAFCYTGLNADSAAALSTREIRSTMLTLSKECLGDITAGLSEQLRGMAGSMAGHCAEKTKNAARSMADSLAGAASTAGTFVLRGGEAVTDAVAGGIGSAVESVQRGTDSVSDAVSGAAGSVRAGTATAKKFFSGAGSFLGDMLGRKKGPSEADARAALRLALLWTQGPLGPGARLVMTRFVSESGASTRWLDLLDREPDLESLSRELAVWHGRADAVLAEMNDLGLPEPGAPEKARLCELGSLLGLGSALAGYRPR